MQNHPLMAEVRLNTDNGQRQMHALRAFTPGEIISDFWARETLDSPTYLTVQVGIDKHILLAPFELQYINHSCMPNVFFDTTAMKLIALTHIREGEELTFFYPSTEWSMAQPFQCYCGQPGCLGLIEGATFLSADILSGYRLTDFVMQQLQLKTKPGEVLV